MGIHYITAIDAPENIQRALDEHLKDSVYRVAEGQWFVDFEGTSKQLSDQIGITDGNLGGAVVMSVSNYFGYGPTDMWEWLSIKWSKRHGGTA